MGIQCSKFYYHDLEDSSISPKVEKMDFLKTKDENFLISHIFTTENKLNFPKQNLLERLDAFNIDSFFNEAQEKIVNQKTGHRNYLLNSDVDLMFKKCQKTWLKIEEQRKLNSLYIIYSYKHLPFTPDLYALSLISNVTSKKIMKRGVFRHEVLEYCFYEDMLVSVWHSKCKNMSKEKGDLHFLYVRILKQLDNNEYFECWKDIKFTNLALEEHFQEVLAGIRNLGQVHNGASRFYKSKDKFYCQSYYELDLLVKDESDFIKKRIKEMQESEFEAENMENMGLLLDQTAETNTKEENKLFNAKLVNSVLAENQKFLSAMELSRDQLQIKWNEYNNKRNLEAINLEDIGHSTLRKVAFPDKSNVFMDSSDLQWQKNRQMSNNLLSRIESVTNVGKEKHNLAEIGLNKKEDNLEIVNEQVIKLSSKKLFTKSNPPVDYDVVNQSPKSTMLKTTSNEDFLNAIQNLKLKKIKAENKL